MDDTGGLTCFKCFNLVLRSSNVLQIHTSALDKCYTTEERAVADCPSDTTIREKRAREIMLYSKFKNFIFYLGAYSLMTSYINNNFFMSVFSIVSKAPFYERDVINERTLGKEGHVTIVVIMTIFFNFCYLCFSLNKEYKTMEGKCHTITYHFCKVVD